MDTGVVLIAIAVVLLVVTLYVFRDTILPGAAPSETPTPTSRGPSLNPSDAPNPSGTLHPDDVRSQYPQLFANAAYHYQVRFDPCPSDLTDTLLQPGTIYCAEKDSGTEVDDSLCFGHDKPYGKNRVCQPSNTPDDGTGYAWQVTDWSECRRGTYWSDLGCYQLRDVSCKNGDGDIDARMCPMLPPPEFGVTRRDCNCPPICRLRIDSPTCPDGEYPLGQYPNEDGTYG
jgi:hypothetical protein